MTFTEAKLEQLTAATTYRVYGERVEHEADAATGRRHYIAISPCLCVWDSPDNPCACKPGTFWWLAQDAIVAQGNSGRQGHHRRELQFFDLFVDSNIIVESVATVSVAALKLLGKAITDEHVRDLAFGACADTVPGIMQLTVGEVLLKAFRIDEIVADVFELAKKYADKANKK